MGVVPIVGADVPRQEAEHHDKAEDEPHRLVTHAKQRLLRTLNWQSPGHKLGLIAIARAQQSPEPSSALLHG
jgi:hypothetical protein